MPKYRAKSAIVDAEPYAPGMEDGARIPTNHNDTTVRGKEWRVYSNTKGYEIDYLYIHPLIETPQGDAFVNKGDWIVTYPDGTRFPFSRSAVEANFEIVE
jgi:hypothetical protein